MIKVDGFMYLNPDETNKLAGDMVEAWLKRKLGYGSCIQVSAGMIEYLTLEGVKVFDLDVDEFYLDIQEIGSKLLDFLRELKFPALYKVYAMASVIAFVSEETNEAVRLNRLLESIEDGDDNKKS